MVAITGRMIEQGFFQELLEKEAPVFLAVYGRRRVGKTFLIREFFKDKGSYFEQIGIRNGSLSEQLLVFSQSFAQTFHPEVEVRPPVSWREAFKWLSQELNKRAVTKTILFFDELPWLAGPKSGFMEQLDHFWNSDWSRRQNLILVVCGSAASWMLEHLIYAKGGLHNRLTNTLKLQPFTLSETAEYLVQRDIRLDQTQVLDLFMAVGGIPFYLNHVQKGLSAAQNINNIYFAPNAPLFDEWERLFSSLFDDAEVHKRIVLELAQHRYGRSREELFQKLDISSGGRAHKRLDELEEGGFITSFFPYKSKKGQYYRLSDEFLWFHVSWIAPMKKSMLSRNRPNVWLKKINTPGWNTWAGYSFENVCYKHLPQIAQALHIENIDYETGVWHKAGSDNQDGAQVDLLFDRRDNVCTLCEIKFSKNKFVIDKSYALELQRKIDVFRTHFKVNKQIFLSMITTNGVKQNAWSKEMMQAEVFLKDLFKTG